MMCGIPMGVQMVEFSSAVKNDAFAPVLIYVLPGAVAAGPYMVVAASFFPQLLDFGKAHPTVLTLIFTLVVILVGALLEEVGSRLELLWDRMVTDPNWEPYLRLRLNDEIIGQRYLRRILLRMKFELSMAVALPLTMVGLAWMNHLHSLWDWPAAGGIVAFVTLLWTYLTWESQQSALLLHKTRHLIIDAVSTSSSPRTS